MSVKKLDEIQSLVGKDIGVSDWIVMDQDRINSFADTTGDHMFAHVDVELAKQTPFGTTIAHGFLTLSMLTLMAAPILPLPDTLKLAINYGLNKVRFIAPVKSGKRIRGHFHLAGFEEHKPGQWLMTLDITVEIEGEDKPAMTAEWLTLYFV